MNITYCCYAQKDLWTHRHGYECYAHGKPLRHVSLIHNRQYCTKMQVPNLICKWQYIIDMLSISIIFHLICYFKWTFQKYLICNRLRMHYGIASIHHLIPPSIHLGICHSCLLLCLIISRAVCRGRAFSLSCAEGTLS